MFITNIKRVPANNEFNMLGSDVIDFNRYISPNLNTLYVQSSSQLNIINNTGPGFYKQAVNVIPYRGTTSTQLQNKIYKGTINTGDDIIIYAHNIEYQSVLGMRLEQATRCTVVKFNSNEIISNDYIKEQCIFNHEMHLIFNVKPLSKGIEFVYFDNCILEQQVDIQYTDIIHPLLLTKHRPIYHYLDVCGNPELKFNITTNSNNLAYIKNITLKRLKILFSPDGVSWYKYNFSSEIFERVYPNTEYISLLELNTHGNSYTEYTEIPLSKFSNTFPGVINKINILSNGWVLPRYIKHNFYSDKLDNNSFIWANTTTNNKRNIYYGDI